MQVLVAVLLLRANGASYRKKRHRKKAESFALSAFFFIFALVKITT